MKEEITIEVYEADNGKSPFLDWQGDLTQKTRDLVTTRLTRIRLGNFGDFKPIVNEKGLFELRMHIGPGYRIYFGKKGRKIVVLLCGGSKGSQKRDIAKAKKYWQECQ